MNALGRIICASLRPALTMTVVLHGGAVVAGTLANDLPTAVVAATWGLGIGLTGLWLHEAAHLWLAERLGERSATVAVVGSMVVVRTPSLAPGPAVWVSLVGPVAGVITSLGWLLVGAPTWIAVALAAVHAANLVPFRGSDGSNAWRAWCRVLVQHWAVQRGVTGGQ